MWGRIRRVSLKQWLKIAVYAISLLFMAGEYEAVVKNPNAATACHK